MTSADRQSHGDWLVRHFGSARLPPQALALLRAENVDELRVCVSLAIVGGNAPLPARHRPGPLPGPRPTAGEAEDRRRPHRALPDECVDIRLRHHRLHWLCRAPDELSAALNLDTPEADSKHMTNIMQRHLQLEDLVPHDDPAKQSRQQAQRQTNHGPRAPHAYASEKKPIVEAMDEHGPGQHDGAVPRSVQEAAKTQHAANEQASGHVKGHRNTSAQNRD
mmetsp:Transcript_60718/g.198794  ORF Transcript_60718/g.198794 Transcript_60718/m.198794 type:complete len:221 (-) Transcript_60718:1084-1746(-)